MTIFANYAKKSHLIVSHFVYPEQDVNYPLWHIFRLFMFLWHWRDKHVSITWKGSDKWPSIARPPTLAETGYVGVTSISTAFQSKVQTPYPVCQASNQYFIPSIHKQSANTKVITILISAFCETNILFKMQREPIFNNKTIIIILFNKQKWLLNSWNRFFDSSKWITTETFWIVILYLHLKNFNCSHFSCSQNRQNNVNIWPDETL